MKKILWLFGAFVAGVALSAIVMWFKLVVPEGRVGGMIYSESVEGNIDTALKLRMGDQENYLKDFDSGLPDFVQGVHYLREDDYTRRALWKAKAYYSATGIPVPPEIAAIFSNLPPSPRENGFSLEESKSTLTKIGDVSPVFSLQTIDGQNLDFHGKVVVLNFFATWCGPCMEEMPFLEKNVWETFKDKGLMFAAVGRKHSETELITFQKQKGYSFPLVADPSGEINGKFATNYIPRSVVIGKDGKIKFQSVGFSPEDFLALVNSVKAELAKP